MNCCQNTTSRRTFLNATGAATAAVTLASCSTGPRQEVFSGGELTQAVELDQLPPGESKQLVVGSSQIILHRASNDTVHAFSAVCTHQGCIIGVNDDAAGPFICPCHASNFDKTTGEAVAGPAQLPLTRHKTTVQNGWVLVEAKVS